VTIRLATDDDWPAILEVHGRAFVGDADVPRLAQELRSSDVYEPGLSFVAVSDGAVVGHVMNTWSGLEGSTVRLLQLSPLGVLPDRQRQGFGSALVRASLAAVRSLGEPLLLVEGNPAYYGRRARRAGGSTARARGVSGALQALSAAPAAPSAHARRASRADARA